MISALTISRFENLVCRKGMIENDPTLPERVAPFLASHYSAGNWVSVEDFDKRYQLYLFDLIDILKKSGLETSLDAYGKEYFCSAKTLRGVT